MPSPGETARGDGGGGGGKDDLLSTLPDALLHHIMSFLLAWEVARTCVLSRRWRHLWATAPCVDLRLWRRGDHLLPPEKLAKFAYRFLLEREVSAAVDTLRVMSSPMSFSIYEEEPPPPVVDYSTCDVETWIRAAIKRRARVIHLTGHPKDYEFPDLNHVPIISRHLKHLKLTGFSLEDMTLRQISSQCPCLEILELKCCFLEGREISSTSLKSLTMVECRIVKDLTIATPNLVSLCCIKPFHQAPLFENLGSLALATGTILLDDSFLCGGSDLRWKENGVDYYEIEGRDTDDDGCSEHSDYDSDASTFEYSEIANDYDDEEHHGEGHNQSKHANYGDYSQRCNNGPYWSYRGYGRKDKFDACEVLGGHNVLHSLSNATSLELLADAGEVILNRELKTCPTFSNLKILSLGEWCMGAEFDPLVSFLQHSPNLESLFLELKLDSGNRQGVEDGAKPEGNSFTCTHLKMVKFKCSTDDARVHLLARLFMANGVPIQNIYVHQTRNSRLPTKRLAT